MVGVRRRLVEAEGVILDPADGTLLARSEATFVGAPEERKGELKARYGFREVLEPGGRPTCPSSWTPNQDDHASDAPPTTLRDDAPAPPRGGRARADRGAGGRRPTPSAVPRATSRRIPPPRS